MAQSRFSSSSPDLMDTASSWQAFEVVNSVKLRMRLESQMVGTRWRLVMVAEAWEDASGKQEAKLLVSESVQCSDTSFKSMDTVAFRLLYALDAKIAFLEMEGAEPK